MTTTGFAYASHFAKTAPVPAPPPVAPVRINFAVGHNDPNLVPAQALAEVAARVIREHGPSLAVYNLGQSSLGFAGLRDFVAAKLAKSRGISIPSDSVLITSGSLQGIDLVNQLLLDPGDHVVVEDFTYGAVFARLRRLGVTWSGAPLDDEGIDVDTLETHFQELAARGVTPKYLYTIPTVQNPTGTVMPLARRQRLVALCRRFGVTIFEDECYADVLWGDPAPPALYALDPAAVIHIGSFSKTLAPALRVGYIVADPQVLARMLALKTDGGTAAVEQMVVAAYFRDHFEDHLATLSGVLQRKLDVMIEALNEGFGTAAEFVRPPGGLFLWVKLPDTVDVRRFAGTAASRGVTFNVGQEWAANADAGTNCLRLCFAMPSEDQIREGVATLAQLCFEATGVPPHGANLPRQRG